MSTGDATLLWIIVGVQIVVLYLAIKAYRQVREPGEEIETLRRRLRTKWYE